MVGYATARAALNPVERYRVAAEIAEGAPVLPVDPGKDDEVTRLGHTFNALLDQIHQANERERQFLADASHELRSPLALMRAELEMALLKPRDASENRTAFESLRGQVERLITLSNALLHLEELRASGSATVAPVDLGALVGEVTDRYVAAAGRRRSGDRCAGHARAQRRRQRALARPRRGQPRFQRAALRRRHHHGDRRTSRRPHSGRVSDGGPGFPDDFVEKAFDRFSRAESSRTSGGTGLGLALVKAVAEAHGGTATVRGTEVSLYLATSAREHLGVPT